jgi:hypothetical protein
MGPQRILSVVLVALGILLFIMGVSASDSVADQVSRTFTGRFTETTTWYIVGGVLCTVLGLVLLGTGGFRGKSA